MSNKIQILGVTLGTWEEWDESGDDTTIYHNVTLSPVGKRVFKKSLKKMVEPLTLILNHSTGECEISEEDESVRVTADWSQLFKS